LVKAEGRERVYLDNLKKQKNKKCLARKLYLTRDEELDNPYRIIRHL